MEFKKLINSLKKNHDLTDRQKLGFIKRDIEHNYYEQALKSYPLLNSLISRNSFFLQGKKIYSRIPIYFTGDYSKEIYWTKILLEKNINELHKFITLKNEFEKTILFGEFEDARQILNEIANKFGISLWLIESEILLENNENGTEYNWGKLSDYLKTIKNPFYEFNINSFSKRVEQSVSYESFFYQFQNEINSINAENAVKDYFIFKNFPMATYAYSLDKLENVIYISSIFSVIDIYIIFVDVLIYNFTQKKYDNSALKDILKGLLPKLEHDNRLWNLDKLLNSESIDASKYNKNYLDCMNQYYTSNFEDSLESSKNYISHNPLDLEIYEIYCKSLIYLDSGFKETNISSEIDHILKVIFDVLTFKKEHEDSSNSLLKYSIKYGGFSFGKQLFALYNEVNGIIEWNYYTGILNSQNFSVKNLIFIKNQFNLYDFSNSINTNAFQINLFKLGIDNFSIDSFNIENEQKKMLTADHYYNTEQYDKLISFYENEIFSKNYQKEKIDSLLVNSFLHVKDFTKALNIFSRVFFDFETLHRKVFYKKLYQAIIDDGKEEVYYGNIDFLVLTSECQQEFNLYKNLDEFLLFHEFDTMKNIDYSLLIQKFDTKKIIYVLKHILKINILKFSTDFESISDVEEERIKILRYLQKIDKYNFNDYDLEIDEILRVNSVRKVLKEAEHGRLYVDVDGLKRLLVKKFTEDFNRFKEIESFSTKLSLVGFNPSNKRNWEKVLSDKSISTDSFNTADYLAFKSIYQETRNNFLFSKEYGLESSLSTRIRHGALKNHIRSVFEKLNLITVKSNGKYKTNHNWELVDSNLNDKVQRILGEFSEKIDILIMSIIDYNMQIQTESSNEKKQGLFSYHTDDEKFFTFYTENKHNFDSVEKTVSILLNNLAYYTEYELNPLIINFFTHNVYDWFNQIIFETINELRKINLPKDFTLVNNLNKSFTEFQVELEGIFNWFNLTTSNSKKLLDIRTIIDASLELTNKINPSYPLNPDIIVGLKADGSSNLLFVFNILLNNIIQHSGLPNEDLSLSIKVFREDRYTVIKFTNNLNEMMSFESNSRKLQNIKDNWNDHSNIERSNKEGESGFDKIKRILIYETKSKTEKFDYQLTKKECSIKLYLPYNVTT